MSFLMGYALGSNTADCTKEIEDFARDEGRVVEIPVPGPIQIREGTWSGEEVALVVLAAVVITALFTAIIIISWEKV